MKKILLIIILLVSFAVISKADTFGPMSGIFNVGISDGGSATSFTVDSKVSVGVSGASTGLVFYNSQSQTSGTFDVAVYCTASTGTANDTYMLLWNGPTGAEDDDRPSPSLGNIATSTTVDMSDCGSGKWKQYAFTGVSLNQASTTFAIIVNNTATPASNNFAVLIRGPLDSYNMSTAGQTEFKAYSTANGFTTDPTGASSITAPMVVKYGNGTIEGLPIVATVSHASNSNTRGIRLNFDEDIQVSGFYLQCANSALSSLRIYQGSTVILNYPTSLHNRINSGVARFASTTLSGGLDYDFVCMFTSNTTALTRYTMGNSPIPDMVNSSVTNATYVDGTAGSLTESATSTALFNVNIFTNPAVSGGSSTDIWGIMN